jgi:hypothetical protein
MVVWQLSSELKYMREWESDPPKMKFLYKDFHKYVRVQENARTATLQRPGNEK